MEESFEGEIGYGESDDQGRRGTGEEVKEGEKKSSLPLGNMGRAFENQKLSLKYHLNLKNTTREVNFSHPLYHM